MQENSQTNLSLAQEDNSVEHMEDLQPGLVDGHDDGPPGLGEVIQHCEHIEGSVGVQTRCRLVKDQHLVGGREEFC